jgi:two-component system, cell cycle response regulator
MSAFRVLLIDDNPYALQTVQSALVGTGYDVDTATNGAEGLEKAAAAPPDVVLLDLVMPGMSGIEVLRQLRANPVLAEVSIVVVTSLDDRATRLEALGAGADEFLGKPINVPELRARLRTLSKVNRYRRLSDERARLAWLAEGSADGFVLLNADGTIAWTNESARRYLDLPARPSDVGVRFLDRARALYSFGPGGTFDEGSLIRGEKAERHLVRPASAKAPALWLRVDLFYAGGEGISVCLRDVTAAFTSFRDSWTIGHVLGHKLRTPLSGVLGILEVISEGRRELSREDLDEWIDLMRVQSGRLKEHLLDLTRLVQRTIQGDAGEPCSPADLSAAARGAADLAGLEAPVAVVVEAEEEVLFALPASRLEPILFELFRNSVRAHPEGKPRIELRLRRPEPGILALEVLDDGVHLPPEALQQLWRPCYQLEAVPTGEAPGTGLGLSYVALLVAEAGGAVKLENRGDRPGIRVTIRVREDLPPS